MDLASPDRYLHSFDGDAAVVVPMDRKSYHRSIFLDGRIAPAAGTVHRVPVAALQPSPGLAPAWIFHMAHCGSTLLARALDGANQELVLREPLALRQLGVAAANGIDVADGVALAVRLYGRRYCGGARALVKANVPVNIILADLLAADPAAPAILLYFGLDDYLAAVLRSPGHRQWVRHVTGELAPALQRLAGPPPAGEAELAAWLWLAQMRVFAAALARFPNVRSLDAKHLFARPRDAIAAAAELFGRTMSDAAIDAMVAGPLFATYAKQPGIAFTEADRRARNAAATAALLPEIAAARAWIDANAADSPLSLGRPLIA